MTEVHVTKMFLFIVFHICFMTIMEFVAMVMVSLAIRFPGDGNSRNCLQSIDKHDKSFYIENN